MSGAEWQQNKVHCSAQLFGFCHWSLHGRDSWNYSSIIKEGSGAHAVFSWRQSDSLCRSFKTCWARKSRSRSAAFSTSNDVCTTQTQCEALQEARLVAMTTAHWRHKVLNLNAHTTDTCKSTFITTKMKYLLAWYASNVTARATTDSKKKAKTKLFWPSVPKK